MKHAIALLTCLLSVLTSPATLVRFNMADITGRTNDLPITVQGLVMPFGSSNYVVIGYPQRLQPVGGTITTNLVPGSYRLSVIGPSPAQTLDFNVTNSASVLDVRDLGSYKLSSFTASQYYTSEQSDARYASAASVSNLVSSGITNGQESVSLPMLVTTNGSLRLSGGGYWSELFPTGDGFNVRSLLPATRGVSLVVGDAEGVQNNLFAGSDWSVERVETILVGNADTGQSVAMTLNTNGVIATTGDFHFTDAQSFAAGLYSTGAVVAASFTGDGSGLTNLNMTNLVGTQLNFGEGATITRGAGEVLEFSTEIVGTHVGTGDGLTNLNASTLASGTVPLARLPAYRNVAFAQTNTLSIYGSTNVGSVGFAYYASNSITPVIWMGPVTGASNPHRVGIGTASPDANYSLTTAAGISVGATITTSGVLEANGGGTGSIRSDGGISARKSVWSGSNVVASVAMVFAPFAGTAGPVGITNGYSAIWNSNGITTYIRSSLAGQTTYTDTPLRTH